MSRTPVLVAALDGNGEAITLRAVLDDTDGSLALNAVTETEAVPRVHSTTLETGRVLHVGPCTLVALLASSGSTGWIVVIDAVAVPADAASIVPVAAWRTFSSFPANISGRIDPPILLANGAVVLFTTSATPDTMIGEAAGYFSGAVVV
jgi:hypothetical protein